MLATMADAHREWHQNTETPMGVAGCPQDACDGEDPRPLIKCAHCKGYHRAVYQVRRCAQLEIDIDRRTCEHGLALWLCEGPNHYGPDEWEG